MQSEWRLQTEKLSTIFYVVNGAALELQFARKSYVSIITLQFWAPERTEIDDLRLFFELLLWNIDV